MRILHFELKGCGTENVILATKFLTFVACLKLLHLYADFHLICTNNPAKNSLIMAHLNI